MIIEKKDLKNGIIKLRPQNQDDLWLLSQIIDINSFATAKTTRKIKISETKVEKKTYILKVSINSVKYENEVLRLLGKVVSEVDDIPKGSSQSLSISINDLLTIEQGWLNYQIEKLEDATKEKIKILLIAMDREEAYFAKMTSNGYEILSNFKGEVFKKSENGLVGGGGFYQEVSTKLEEYYERLNVDKIIVASPAFFKEDFLKQFKNEEIKKKIHLATISSVGSNSFVELLKREEVKAVFSQERFEKELFYVDKFFEELSKDGKCTYGLDQIKQKTEQGSVEILLLTTKLINAYREKEEFKTLENLMKLVEQINGKVMIIESSNDAGKRLDGITGIGAILRY